MLLNEFLINIANDLKVKGKKLSSDDFYYILKYIGIEKNDTLAQEVDNFYREFLDSLSNSLVKYESKSLKEGVNKTNYLGFYVDKKSEIAESMKVYFPVKYEYLISALKTVFLYLVRNNIKAIVKFHEKATNEAIVIEFYNKEEVLPFINYCHNNFILKDLLEKLNPFMVSYNGFGIVRGIEGSYLQEIAQLLKEYFDKIEAKEQYDKVSGLDFLSFVIDLKDTTLEDRNYEIIIKNIKTLLNNKGILEEKDLS